MGLKKKDLDKEIKYLSLKEIDSIFKAISKGTDRFYLRNLCIFRLGYETACRASEMALFTVADYNSSNRSIYCRRLKNGNNNTVRLSKETSRLLNKYIKECKLVEDDILFNSQQHKPIDRKMIDVLCKRYFKAAKIKDIDKYHFHTLRHTRAVIMLEQGFTLQDVQFLLGHKNIANTQIYAKYSANYQKQLFDRMDKIQARSCY